MAALGGGECVKLRFADILHPVPPDNRTPEERFTDTVHSLGFRIKGVDTN